jgi:hypothetical protein
MNLIEFYFDNNGLHLIFDNEFKHIKFDKYEKAEANTINKRHENVIGLEHDYTELTFTKHKKKIVIFTNEYSDIVIINIKEIDNKPYCFSNLFIKQQHSSVDQGDAILKGLTALLSHSSQTNNVKNNIVNETREQKVIIQLKNENISADFIRK